MTLRGSCATMALLLCAGVGAALRAEAPASSPPLPTTAAATAPQVVGQPPTEQLLAQLRRNVEGQRTIQASFHQEKKLKALNHTMKLAGYFVVERPKRIAWHVTEPVRYSVLLQDGALRQWDEDSDRVQTIRFSSNPAVKAAMEQFQAWFLGNYAVVADSYNVVITGTAPLAMRFTPKEQNTPAARIVQEVDIVFTPDLMYLQSLVLLDGNRDTTTITFEDVRFNEQPAPSVWEIPPRAR